jgi:hypothetical protein
MNTLRTGVGGGCRSHTQCGCNRVTGMDARDLRKKSQSKRSAAPNSHTSTALTQLEPHGITHSSRKSRRGESWQPRETTLQRWRSRLGRQTSASEGFWIWQATTTMTCTMPPPLNQSLAARRMQRKSRQLNLWMSNRFERSNLPQVRLSPLVTSRNLRYSQVHRWRRQQRPHRR